MNVSLAPWGTTQAALCEEFRAMTGMAGPA